MIKQTLMFTSPVALSLKYGQLVVKSLDDDKTLTRPVEDLDFVIIDNPMISLTIPLLKSVTDKQYGDIVNYWGKKEKDKKILTEPVQLEIIW